MILGGNAFRPASSPARFTVIAVIAGAHLALVSGLALMGGTVTLLHEAKPLFVRFVAPPHALPSPPVAPRVPLPAMRAPDIRLPEPPAIETAIAVRLEERPSAAREVSAGPPLAGETLKPAREAAPAQPPRFDLAYLNNPAPVYPPISRKLREEGRVVLRVLVNASGLVESIEMVTTSGHARLDQAALAAVRRWKFIPARAGERAVAGWALVPVAFNLQA